MESGRKRIGRKLLVASLGVATVSYGACSSSEQAKQDAGVDTGQVADAADHADAAAESPFTPPDGGADRYFVGNII
jgi:hypothetical protein